MLQDIQQCAQSKVSLYGFDQMLRETACHRQHFRSYTNYLTKRCNMGSTCIGIGASMAKLKSALISRPCDILEKGLAIDQKDIGQPLEMSAMHIAIMRIEDLTLKSPNAG